MRYLTWGALTLGAGLIAGTLSAQVLVPHVDPDAPRTVEFNRSAPCSTCGAATPVTITCAGLTWAITQPGTIAHAAASVCPPNTTYSWEPTK